MFPAGKAYHARMMDISAVKRGVSSLILMENAAFSLYLEVVKVIEHFKPEKIVAFAGRGGNGGDSFALLRILKDRGCDIPMFIMPLFDEKDLLGDSFLNWKILPGSIETITADQIKGKILFIDGMIGTGLKSDLSGKIKDAVAFISGYKEKFVVSIDVPTGLNSDNGKIMGEAVKADITVTLGMYKTGLFAEKGPFMCGKIILGHISANNGDIPKTGYFVEDSLFPEPVNIPVDSYKNKCGHLLIIGGDVEKLGATIIAARSFMASGGGLVTAAFRKDIHLQVAGVMPGMMLADIDDVTDRLNDFDSIIIGPGLSKWPFKSYDVFKNYKGSIIADAGMFDLVSDKIAASLKNCKVVFTPHPGELKRFLDAGSKESWIEQVERFPLEKNHVLVAKSHAPFIKFPEKTVIVPHGAKALSFGGTGDALTGVLAFETFFNGLNAGVVRAVLRHRLAGVELEKKNCASFHDIDSLINIIGNTGD